jgi:hypothetical protein
LRVVAKASTWLKDWGMSPDEPGAEIRLLEAAPLRVWPLSWVRVHRGDRGRVRVPLRQPLTRVKRLGVSGPPPSASATKSIRCLGMSHAMTMQNKTISWSKDCSQSSADFPPPKNSSLRSCPYSAGASQNGPQPPREVIQCSRNSELTTAKSNIKSSDWQSHLHSSTTEYGVGKPSCGHTYHL